LAADISIWNEAEFSRENLRRLRHGGLGPQNVEIIIRFLEENHDPNIRERLRPEAIFDELAQPARDYYFHIPEANDIDDWSNQILDEFSGVYFCAPAAEVNSFMPTSYVRKWLANTQDDTKPAIQEGKLNPFIQRRSILILRKTAFGYFYAAELPLSALATPDLKSTCQRVFYEGIGIISANTIQIKLRDCLSRVAKTHAIVVGKKFARSYELPHDLNFHVFHNQAEVIAKWGELSHEDIGALKQEQRLTIASEYFLQGTVAEPTSPIANRKHYVSMVVPGESVYFKKPDDFLEHLGEHFALDQLADTATLRKIFENPLVVGTLDEN
jgi:hypothetical protein